MTPRLVAAEHDGWVVTGFKGLLYAASLSLYLLQLSSPPGIGAAVVAAALGMAVAALAHRHHLRVPVTLFASALGLGLALAAGAALTDAREAATLLGIQQSLMLADILVFGISAFCVVFMLRRLALRTRSASLLEVLFVAGSVVALLADHRNRMLNRPRFFSDWVWTHGYDPATILAAVGIGLTIVAIFLFLRGQRLLKLLTSLVLLFILGIAYFLLGDLRVERELPQDAIGITGKKGKKDKSDKGKGGGGGGGGGGGVSDNPFKNDYSQNDPPTPVAIAILRDDFEPRNDVIYFRQAVLSLYNGNRLVRDTSGRWDRDVISDFPGPKPALAVPAQVPDNHLEVPSTMYLLVDHPQPIGLGHPHRYMLVKNPNPQQFVAAYDVRSYVLSIPSERLLGRRSIPATFTDEMRRHYTVLPEDPRYRALSDIILRDMDPRFAHDDLARAYALKRYLEQEGYYTLKSTHASEKDPAASFLFGSLRGYCVHFAHAAVYLFRSQGIAARVALGYAVQTSKRGGGSAVLIMSDRAHAWPEVFLEGIGWVTYDIYPERTDMPPPTMVDYDLEKLLGELARNDKTAGLSESGQPLVIPWRVLLRYALFVVLGLLGLAYLIKAYRRLAPRLRRGPAYPRLAYMAVLDRLSDLGQQRLYGETRERHAARLATLCPGFQALTRLHLGRALGSRLAGDPQEVATLVNLVGDELRRNVHPLRRALALLNPVGWMLTR